MSSPTKPVTSWGLRPPSRQNQYSPSRASNPQTMLSTPSGLRPASRQEQYLPTLSRAYNSPSSNQSSQANPKMQPTLVPFTLKNGSTASLAPKPSLPEHAQQNGRRRAQSFSLQKPAPTSNPNKSWPQLSVERDNREQAPLRRRQILFYDRQHPYYEFTNFSEHPVKYKGKKYPTSEHLFQSFKVSRLLPIVNDFEFHYSFSFKTTGQALQNTFDYIAQDQVMLFQKPVDFSQKYVGIGCK